MAAMAQPAPPPAAPNDEADRLMKEGIELGNQSRWPEAHAKLKEAWKIRESYDIAANLAFVEEEVGDLPGAATHLDYALRTFPASGKPETKANLTGKLAGIKAKVGTITVSTTVEMCNVMVDGQPAGVTPLKTSVYVTPGERTIEVRREGYQPQTRKVTVGAGQAADVTFDMVKGDSTTPGGEEKPIWPAIVLGGAAGVGIALTIAGFVLAADAKSSAEDIALEMRETGDDCESAQAQCDLAQERLDEHPTFFGLGVAGAVVGGLSLVGMIVYLAVPFGDDGASTSTGIKILPMIGSTNGLVLQGQF